MKHLSLLGVVLWIVSLGLNVQAQDNPAQPTDTSAAEAKADKPAATKDEAAKKKIRSGSYLVGNRGIQPEVDRRGDFERRRDLELIKHYTRRAQLDVIARRAKQVGQTEYLERLDRIRRIEDERHRLRMKEITEGSLFLDMRGLP